MDVDIVFSFFVGFIVCCVVVAFGFGANNPDVDLLGEYMCTQHNLTFVNAETNMGMGDVVHEDNYLKVKCGKQTQVDDGYLILVG